mgnify:FL=1
MALNRSAPTMKFTAVSEGSVPGSTEPLNNSAVPKENNRARFIPERIARRRHLDPAKYWLPEGHRDQRQSPAAEPDREELPSLLR